MRTGTQLFFRTPFQFAAVLSPLALVFVLPGSASGATLAQAGSELRAWRLKPPPLFPSQLPASHRSVNVHLYRFKGVEYVIDFGAPDNADCHTLPNPNGWCVQLRRLAGTSLGAWLHDPAIYGARRMRVGNRNVWFFGDGGNAGGWWMAWLEQGRTYGAWAWTDEPTALRRLTPFVESLRPLSSGCADSVWHRLACNAGRLKTVASCGLEIAGFGALKAIKGIKVIKGSYDARKVSKALQPVYKVYNDLMRLRLKNGTTGAEIWKKLQKARKVKDLVGDLIDVGKLIGDTHDKSFEQFVKDFADLAGVGSCVDLVVGGG